MRYRIHHVHYWRVRPVFFAIMTLRPESFLETEKTDSNHSTFLLHAIRASDVCKQHGKKTISGDDVIQAISNLGFDEYVEPLKAYLSKYRQVRQIPYFPYQTIQNGFFNLFTSRNTYTPVY